MSTVYYVCAFELVLCVSSLTFMDLVSFASTWVETGDSIEITLSAVLFGVNLLIVVFIAFSSDRARRAADAAMLASLYTQMVEAEAKVGQRAGKYLFWTQAVEQDGLSGVKNAPPPGPPNPPPPTLRTKSSSRKSMPSTSRMQVALTPSRSFTPPSPRSSPRAQGEMCASARRTPTRSTG